MSASCMKKYNGGVISRKKNKQKMAKNKESGNEEKEAKMKMA